MSHLLIRGNALRIPLADESVQCCICSPPYWGLRDYSCTGQLGLEPTPDEFVARMVDVFREVRRVLRSDGTCFVNLGDSYAGSGKGPSNSISRPHQCMSNVAAAPKGWLSIPHDCKPKDLIGIPWRVALALQADGWYLRSDIIWAKPNPMPESVTDRPTKSHEYVFLLTKSERYYWDAEAVREPHVDFERGAYGKRVQLVDERPQPGVRNRTMLAVDQNGAKREYNPAGRNIRTVWNINEEDQVEWIAQLGFCGRCNGLRVAGNGSALTIRKGMGDSGDQANVRLIGEPGSLPGDQSQTDSRLTISAETRDALIRIISKSSRSRSTLKEDSRNYSAHKGINSLLKTLLHEAINENVVSVCECDHGSNELKSVWHIATESYPGAHFATYPRALVTPCVKAGTSEKGCCPECGKGWEREVEVGYEKPRGESVIGAAKGCDKSNGWSGYPVLNKTAKTTGWHPACQHNHDPIPCLVFDPFCGSGTTGVVAEGLHRNFVGIDLSADYLNMARQRIERPHKPIPRPGRVEFQPLFRDLADDA